MITHLRSLIINDLNFATFFYDGKTDFQLSISLFWFLLPLSLFVCWLTTSFFLARFPPLPPPSLPQTHHAFCCLCGCCRPCDGHRGAGTTRRFERAQVVSAGGVSGCLLFCQLPLFSPPHTPDIQTHTLTQNTLTHTQAWPEFIDKLKQVRG
jgi:hypothetical protein